MADKNAMADKKVRQDRACHGATKRILLFLLGVAISGNTAMAGIITFGPPPNLNFSEGGSQTLTVGAFTDSDSSLPVSSFTSMISWGDGTNSSGTITALGSGQFSVSGAHTYVEEGSYIFTVSATESGGSFANAQGVATVSDAPLTGFSVTDNTPAGGSFSFPLGSFTDANPSSTVTDFAATVNWGDGTALSIGTIAANGIGNFSVGASHTYLVPGDYTASVQVTDVGGSTSTVSDTIQISPPPVPEPASFLLFGAGAAILFLARLRRRASSPARRAL